MSIKADLFTDPYGNIIMSMSGHLSFEILPHLRDELLYLSKRSKSAIIFIDFKNVFFVGSSGIGNFVELINHINKNKPQIKIFNLSPEFRKVFKLYKIEDEAKTILEKNAPFPNSPTHENEENREEHEEPLPTDSL